MCILRSLSGDWSTSQTSIFQISRATRPPFSTVNPPCNTLGSVYNIKANYFADIKKYTIENCPNIEINLIKGDIFRELKEEKRLETMLVIVVKGSSRDEVEDLREEFSPILEQIFDICHKDPESERVIEAVL